LETIKSVENERQYQAIASPYQSVGQPVTGVEAAASDEDEVHYQSIASPYESLGRRLSVAVSDLLELFTKPSSDIKKLQSNN
jgi:hypothetical protein